MEEVERGQDLSTFVFKELEVSNKWEGVDPWGGMGLSMAVGSSSGRLGQAG